MYKVDRSYSMRMEISRQAKIARAQVRGFGVRRLSLALLVMLAIGFALGAIGPGFIDGLLLVLFAVNLGFLAGLIVGKVIRMRVYRTGWRHGLSDMSCGRDFNPDAQARLPRRYLVGPFARRNAVSVYMTGYASAIQDLHRGKELEELDGEDLARVDDYLDNAKRVLDEVRQALGSSRRIFGGLRGRGRVGSL